MSDKKLLPCPFCNAGLESYSLKWVHPLSGSCLLSGYSMLRGTREIELWNTRVPMQKIVERLEESKQGAKDSKDLSKYSAYEQSINIVKGVIDANN